MQSDVPVGLAVASSLQRRSPPGSRKPELKKLMVPRSRQLALVRAHQLLLRLPSRPSTTNSWARTKTPNRKCQMAVLRLQTLRLSQRSSAPVPVLVRRAMAGRLTRGLQLEKSILRIRRTRTSGWDRLPHMGTNELAVRIGSASSDPKTRNRGVLVVERCMIGNVVDCWPSVWSAGCTLCCSPRFAYVYVFAFLFLDGVLDPPGRFGLDMPGHACRYTSLTDLLTQKTLWVALSLGPGAVPPSYYPRVGSLFLFSHWNNNSILRVRLACSRSRHPNNSRAMASLFRTIFRCCLCGSETDVSRLFIRYHLDMPSCAPLTPTF